MRQLAALPSADAAQTLADHLQTLRIDTRLERLPDACLVWVCDEDRLEQAKRELASFTENPRDPRFTAARKAADARRRREEREAEEETNDALTPSPQMQQRARQPVWTYGLILTSTLVFAAHIGALIYFNRGLGAAGESNILIWGRTDNQEVLTSPAQQALSIASFVIDQGAGKIRWDNLYDIRRGEVWRLVTPIFLHFGLVHLLFNMIMLWQLGSMIELRRGAWRYLLFILLCAVASNLAQYCLGGGVTWDAGPQLHPSPLFGGFSGVLYGLLGYIWMKSRYEPELGLSVSPRTVVWLLAWLVLCMTGGLGPVANVAHVAGLIFGVVIGATPHLWRLARATRTR